MKYLQFIGIAFVEFTFSTLLSKFFLCLFLLFLIEAFGDLELFELFTDLSVVTSFLDFSWKLLPLNSGAVQLLNFSFTQHLLYSMVCPFPFRYPSLFYAVHLWVAFPLPASCTIWSGIFWPLSMASKQEMS